MLTRDYGPRLLSENDAYLRGLMEKWFYAKTNSGVFDFETSLNAKIFKLVEVGEGQVLDWMISDVKEQLDEVDDVSDGRIISVEIGSSTTSPLYTDHLYRN